ncbi:dimethylamine monooxygenase subunit DmmA family protein [Nocardia sp. NPDC052112]|uniref:dimethylamine monooxygenase subunit DmmA family protein n=1 Tax=Nocardia sp. NPDC052112 TaxID=3155646 RepID=UPI00344AAE71
MSAPTIEQVPPQFPSLPHWPATVEPVDTTGTSFLVLAVGGGSEAAAVAREWTAEAEALGPTTLALLDAIDHPPDRDAFQTLLGLARTGVRVMVVGGQYDVLQTLSLLRRSGASEAELRSFVTDHSEIPVFCAHCRTTFRALTAPGGAATCPGCRRELEVHKHMAALLGSFLASDANARTL